MFIDYDTADGIFSILCEECGHIWKLTKEDFDDETDYAWYFSCPRCGEWISIPKFEFPVVNI